jgi:hypothetical protein
MGMHIETCSHLEHAIQAWNKKQGFTLGTKKVGLNDRNRLRHPVHERNHLRQA